MPTTYKRCDADVLGLAASILCEYESHKPLLDARVQIDLVFAMPELDEDGHPKTDALKKNGVKALGITKKIGSKDRALGRGDAEIVLDHYWWTQTASEEMQKALLDHELHHIAVVVSRATGRAKMDENGRPVIRLRHHDYDIGWFNIIAARHGEHSQERRQARQIADEAGQYYWPEMEMNAPGERPEKRS